MPTLCVIVVSTNEKVHLERCLSALTAQTRAADELLVVDNASSDGSPELVRASFPGVRLMALNSSAGTAAAVNLVLDESTADLIGVVLPKFIAEPGWIEALMAAEARGADSWASLILREDGRVDSAGIGMSVVGRPIHLGRGGVPSDPGEPRAVFGCCYPALLYRRSMLVDVLGFDSDFFEEADEIDVAFRGQLRGHTCEFVPAARGTVIDSGGRQAARQVFLNERNLAFVFWQNMPTGRLLLYLPERTMHELGIAVLWLLQLRGLSWFRGKFNAFRNLGKMLKKRSRVQSGRSVDGRSLRGQLTRNWLRRS